MTEREALLRAVCENPDDDTPRLVFADWLDENGEPERAEFIRLQVLMAQTEDRQYEDWPRWQRLCARESALLRDHDEEWWRELPEASGYLLGRLFSRGFVTNVFIRAWQVFVRNADMIFRVTPLESAEFQGEITFTPAHSLRHLARFKRLDFTAAELSEADVLAIFEAPLPNLKCARLRTRPEDQTIRLFLETRFGKRLHYIA